MHVIVGAVQGEMPCERSRMSEKPVGEIFGRHDTAAPAAAETATASGASEPVPSAVQAGATPADGAEKPAEQADPIAGLKSALDKERERAARFEKDWKASQRASRQRDQQFATMAQELAALRAS